MNTRSGQARTPLHVACSRQNKLMARTLLQNGALPNLQDAHGNTALHLIAQSNNRDLLLHFLQAAKRGSVDKTLLNADGKSPADCTANRDIRRVLQPAGIPSRLPEISAKPRPVREMRQVTVQETREGEVELMMQLLNRPEHNARAMEE